MTPGPRSALPDLDAPVGAGSWAATRDFGLDIFAAAADPGLDPTMTAPPLDPTLGGRRRPVGVASGAAATDNAVVPIRAVLGGRPRRQNFALLRLRRQVGVAALTVVTLMAGLGSVWTVRAVFAHVPHTRAPAVWRMETHSTHDTEAALRAQVAAAGPAHSATASQPSSRESTSANRGAGSLAAGSGHRSGSSHKASGSTATTSTEVHHHKRHQTSATRGGADDPATHDATPTAAADDNGGGGGAVEAQPTATPSALPTGGVDTSGGGSGGGGGGGGGHDGFVAED